MFRFNIVWKQSFCVSICVDKSSYFAKKDLCLFLTWDCFGGMVFYLCILSIHLSVTFTFHFFVIPPTSFSESTKPCHNIVSTLKNVSYHIWNRHFNITGLLISQLKYVTTTDLFPWIFCLDANYIVSFLFNGISSFSQNYQYAMLAIAHSTEFFLS